MVEETLMLNNASGEGKVELVSAANLQANGNKQVEGKAEALVGVQNRGESALPAMRD